MRFSIHSIKVKNLLLFFAVFLLFALCLMYFVQKIMTQELEDKALITAMHNGEQVTQNIDNYLEQMSSVYLNIAADEKLVDELESSPTDNNYEYIINKFNTLVSSYKNIYSLFLYDIKDDVYIDTIEWRTVLRDDTWVREAESAEGKKILIYTMDNEERLNLIGYAGSVKKDYFNETLAYISVNAAEIFMREQTLPPKIYDNSIQFIMDDNDRVVFGDLMESIDFIAGKFRGHSGYFSTILGDIKHMVVYSISEDNGWKFVQLIPEKEIYHGIYKVRDTFNLVFVLSTLIGLILSYIVSKQYTNPIYKLVDMMKKYRNKEESYKAIHINRKDEFNYLYGSFNDMIERVDYLIDEVYKADLYKKDVELKNIQESINPHFIYNILDSITWVFKFGKHDKGIYILETFSTYLRNTLNSKKDFITVNETKDELIAYCELQKFFFNDDIDYSIDFEEEILKYTVMTLLLQPVVENTFVHGFKNLKRSGVLHVSGSKKEDTIVFKIKDNGRGLGPEELKNLREKMENFDIEEGYKYFGLGSVCQRIKLVYGQEYGVKVNSRKDGGTEVIISIPAQNRFINLETC